MESEWLRPPLICVSAAISARTLLTFSVCVSALCWNSSASDLATFTTPKRFVVMNDFGGLCVFVLVTHMDAGKQYRALMLVKHESHFGMARLAMSTPSDFLFMHFTVGTYVEFFYALYPHYTCGYCLRLYSHFLPPFPLALVHACNQLLPTCHYQS